MAKTNQGAAPSEPIYEYDTQETYVKRFRMNGTKITFKFNKPPASVSEIDWVRRGFSQLVEKMKEGTSENDQLGFTLTSLNLKSKDPGYVAFRPATEVEADILWQIFGGIIQSNADSVKTTDTFTVACTRVNLPVGLGRMRPGFYNTYEEECRNRKGIVVIKNSDGLCLPRALVVAKAHVKKNPLYEAIRKNKGGRQTARAEKLVGKARVAIPEGGAGIPELQKFQDHLKKYNITVYNYNSKGRDVYFCGNNGQAQFNLNLLFHNGHYNVITSLTAAFVCKYYCQACHVPYDHRGEHRCENICPQCLTVSPPCKEEHGGIPCPDCNMTLKNPICFAAHKGQRCKTVKKCKDCGKLVCLKGRRKSKPHVCGEIYCCTCKEFMVPEHQCYMKVDTRKPKTDGFLYIFFDLETRQDECLNSETEDKVHKVNLCVSQRFCPLCATQQDCDSCLPRTRVFREDPIKDFIDYVLEERKAYKNVCAIAHNGQGFDFQFILKHLLENTKFTPELIMRGTKIILLEVDNLRFVDSLSYFPMALAALPKAFDLSAEKKKGYFPHLFNTLANSAYVGPMPPKDCYGAESTFKEETQLEAFNKWYDDQVRSNYVFDFQKELLEYCLSDVDILAQACLKFRTLFLAECNVDPFLEATTIASACNLAFRRNFLRPDTIGLVPKNGYRMADPQSRVALQWLSWEEENRGVQIRHAGRQREVRIEGMLVDGVDDERIYEFQGCYYHGCPKCYPYKREEPLKEDPADTLHNRYERTKAKMAQLRRMEEYEVVEMWECEFRALKRRENLTHLDTLPILSTLPLEPRDAFFGGRTGNSKTYHRCEDEEQINYVDVCSLYPYICKYGAYPLGHPQIHIGDAECRLKGVDVDGLLKCKVLPPVDLYHPVLPTKMNSKLMFVLCRTCGQRTEQGDCRHNDEERALTGTWTMHEIRKALSKGYVVLEMYEMWEYRMARFEPGGVDNNGLFTEFIDKFLKMKQEASGYPAWCVTEDDKERYVADYFDHEGIRLDREKIEKNGGLRSLAKLMLNSFWGKFGQRENQSKASVVRDPSALFTMLTSPAIQVNTIKEINQDVLLVNWQHIVEVGEPLSTVNVVHAAFTTSQARLKLYEHLEALGSQVLYYDTDSVLYVYRGGLYRVPTGDHLGEMTDELAGDYGPGSYITEFVSGGPKTYAYIVWSTKHNKHFSVCKIKGLTLNLKTSKILNFEKLKEMVLSERCLEMPVVTEDRIRRTKDRDLVTVKETKVFRITGPKRRHEGDYDTLPYGYKKNRTV